jgi:hypothetical protein
LRPRHPLTWLLCAAAVAAVASIAWAADEAAKPQVSLTVAKPAAGAELRGLVEVVVGVAPADIVPTDMYVGLGGPPFARMARVKATGQWVTRLDTTLAPNGETQLIVLASTKPAKRVQQTVAVKLDNPLRAYIGDIHAHSFYSDGALLPTDALTFARKVAKLDFFVLTDHVASVDEREWADTREQVWKANEDGKFVTFPAVEWSGKGGHCCLFDAPVRAWPGEITALYQAAKDAGVIGQFNHPGTRFGDFNAFAYSEVGDAVMRLIEVRVEPEEQYYIEALGNGWHLAPVGTDDAHSAVWGKAGRWTVILAPGLSRLNVWTALKSRHCYSTLDRNCLLDFRLNGAAMGDIIADKVPSAKAIVTISDPDKGDTIAKAELYEDGKVVQHIEPGSTRCRWESAPLAQPGSHYYFVKVTQADNQKLWSAPIWVTIGR